MTNKKWKSKLLSTGLPLEYQAAKLLVDSGFSVDSDFKYSRIHEGHTKEFSVDLRGMATLPFDNPDQINSDVYLLIECKYRYPTVSWLFLPEPNDPDYSPITLGTSIRLVDQFSEFKGGKNGTTLFDKDLPFAFKGLEINLDKGDAHDAEILHGISQLRYALPHFVSSSIHWCIDKYSENIHPFFFCPILLTTSKLYIANESFNIEKLNESDKLEDFSKEVPFLIIYSDYGPEFETHCKNEFRTVTNLDNHKSIRELNDLRAKNEVPGFNQSIMYAKSLAHANRYSLHQLFTQFVICNLESLENLISNIKLTTIKAENELIQLN